MRKGYHVVNMTGAFDHGPFFVVFNSQGHTVCRCFTESMAKKIAALMNASAKKRKG